MEKKYCKDCGHFKQHYALDQGRIFQVYCGHCMKPTVKHKRPDTVACDLFIPAEPDEDAFVTKEYLSKKLLSYMLELELLPKIEDMQ